MLRSVWAAYNEAHPDKTLTNPRSGAAGTLMQKDPEAAAAADRVLRFFAFGADRDGDGYRGASLGGIEDVATAVVRRRRRGHRRRRTRSATRRDGLDYDVDGAVVRLHEPARVRGRRLQRGRAARRHRVQVPARGAHDEAARGRVAGRQDRPHRRRGRESSRSSSAA